LAPAAVALKTAVIAIFKMLFWFAGAAVMAAPVRHLPVLASSELNDMPMAGQVDYSLAMGVLEAVMVVMAITHLAQTRSLTKVAQLAVVGVLVDMDHRVPAVATDVVAVITEVQEEALTVMPVVVAEPVQQNNLPK